MGKRVVVDSHDRSNQDVTPVTAGHRNSRKRKCNSNISSNKKARISSSEANCWHENDDEDSSNDALPLGLVATKPRNASSKQGNNSSILLNNSLNLSLTSHDNNSSITESPKPVYTLRPSIVNGTVLYDLTQKPWRLGCPIGKGNFGEIFLASDNIRIPVTNENAKFVVKIEPHSNGPLFVEIHCLMNTAKKNRNFKNAGTSENEKIKENGTAYNLPKDEPTGIPDYIASGSHYFGNAKYRFLVLPRFDRDLHSLIKKCRVHQKSVLTLAIHIVNVLENLHDRGYCHNDVKAQNLMISKCVYLAPQQKKTTTLKSSSNFSNRNVTAIGKQQQQRIKSSKYDENYDEKQQTTDSGNSSEQEANDEEDEDFVLYNSKEMENDGSSAEEDEDFDDGATTNSMSGNSVETYHTSLNKSKQYTEKRTSSRNVVQYSGSNPVRSCRRDKPNSIYDEMVKSHYLRPTKRISYTEFFNEDGISLKSHGNTDNSSCSDVHSNTSDDESEEFVPLSVRRSMKLSSKKSYTANMEFRRLTRRQEKLLGLKCDVKKDCNTTTNDDGGIKNKFRTDKSVNLASCPQNEQEWVEVREERIFLIDYGLASKFVDNGVHRPFIMDQRRAHDGTLEFTSRDAHMGAHSRRSDMECLGYNLIFWSQGYLPWKEAAVNQQQEKVHRAKEFLMTNVRELLRQIYGKQVPKYLGEYLHLVGQLAYHERPDYSSYRRLFEREYEQLNYSLSELRLQMTEIQQTCVRVKEEIENKNDLFETNKNNDCNMVLNIMQNLSVGGTPFHERTLSNRVSPKNLRSKSDKKETKKKFSWAEVLSQDPDQIARERAEKEFDREEELSEVQQPTVRRYQGKPTYAIISILARLGRSVSEYEEETIKLKREYKRGRRNTNENKMETDECDNKMSRNNENGADVDDDYHNQSDDDGETDATESSVKYARRKIAALTTLKQRANAKRKANTNSRKKATAVRKLILKTPNPTLRSTDDNNTPLSTIPICTRTRGKVAATKIIDLSSPSPKVTKATATRKRKSAIKTVGHNSSSAAEEIEQHQIIFNSSSKRGRAKRRLLKNGHSTSESLQYDSNSNCSPGVWKINSEEIFSRDCRK